MRLSRLLLVLTTTLLSPACDQLLEEDPASFVGPSNFYNNAEDAVAAVNAMYVPLRTQGAYVHAIWWLGDISTDDVMPGPGVNNRNILSIDQYSHGPVNDRIELAWQHHFDGINRTNAVLERVPAVNMDTRLRERLLGEAHFLRGLYYFNLVRWFGGVPLLTTETKSLNDLDVKRASAEEIYSQIVRDLQAAETRLEARYTGKDVGRATSGAARSLLAKVYLTRREWERAAEKAREVVGSGTYSLWPTYPEAFSLANENGRESVFEVQFQSELGGTPNTGNVFSQFVGPRNTSQRPVVLIGYFGSYWPTMDIYNSYPQGDRRKSFSFFTSYTLNGRTTDLEHPHVYKHFDESVVNSRVNDSNRNFPVIRYADVLLMYAEALNELNRTGEAYAYINPIRQRAGLAPLAGLSQAEMREAVHTERRLELAFEGHRWFDLVRTGRLVSTMRAKGNANIRDHHVLYPIPQRELDVNPALQQNPGY